MDIRTLLYLLLGMPVIFAAAGQPLTSTNPHPRRRLPLSRPLRSSSASSRPHRPRAAPVASSSPFFVPSTAKLPLTALQTRNGKNAHLHPQVLLQQHVNRSLKRHAKMTNGASPSDEHLAHKIRKRWESVQPARAETVSPSIPAKEKRERRRWRGGEALAGATAAMQHMKDRVATILAGSSSPSVGASAVFSASSSSARVGVSGDVGASISTQRVAATVNATTGEENELSGYSELSLAAAMNNTITEAEPVTAANALGLAIEANDVGYFAEVQLGSNNKTFRILMDSGSADFWVPSEACTDCGPHPTLGPLSSSSFLETALPFSVTYGTGNVAGTTVVDDAVVAGLSVKGLKFGAVTSESEDFSDEGVPFDGLMGLALSSLSSQSLPTPIERMRADGLVAAAQMGYKLGRVGDGKNDGEVTFGGVDGSRYVGGLAVVENVSGQGFWEAPLLDILVNNLSISSPSSLSSSSSSSFSTAERTAILDTGTTLIIAPPADAEAVHRLIPGARADGQGGFTLPCTTTSLLTFTFRTLALPSSSSSSNTSPPSNSASFSLRPSDLTFLPLSPDHPDGDCVSSISAGDVGGRGEWLVGAAFLKNVYFATDVESNMMGLGTLAE
ncbi:hypothetical protein JCM6882_002160 [Rhodosporidiobolus microsporus]